MDFTARKPTAVGYANTGMQATYRGNGTTNLTSLEFATGSVERMRISELSNVGIGTTAPTSTLQVNGSLAANYRSITATGATTLLATDFYVVYNGTAAGTFTLPSGLNVKGRLVNVKNTTAAQTLPLNTTGSETIDGVTSITVPAGQSCR